MYTYVDDVHILGYGKMDEAEIVQEVKRAKSKTKSYEKLCKF